MRARVGPLRAALGIGAALGLVLAGSCGRLPVTHYYLLEPREAAARAGDAAPGAGGLSVGVRPFRVDPPYDQDRIVYRIGDSAEVRFYDYHRWAAPLGRMLPALVSAALDGVPGLARIEPAVPGREYSAWLRGRVRAVEEIDLPSEERVRVDLVLELIRAEDGAAIWSSRLSRETALSAGDVADVVERMRAALEEVLLEARAPLGSTLRR